MEQRTKAWNLRFKVKAELFPEVECNSYSNYIQTKNVNIWMPCSIIFFFYLKIYIFFQNKQKYFWIFWLVFVSFKSGFYQRWFYAPLSLSFCRPTILNTSISGKYRQQIWSKQFIQFEHWSFIIPWKDRLTLWTKLTFFEILWILGIFSALYAAHTVNAF